MIDLAWDAPGPGVWELETTHASRPWSLFVQDLYVDAFARGFQQGTARYGLMLSHIQPAFVHGYFYMQARPFGAPPGASPPPKPVLWALTRLHPKIRTRLKESATAFEEKRWRTDLKVWDSIDKPEAIEKHRAIQAVDVGALSDLDLADHIAHCHAHAGESVILHHKYTIPAVLVTGDFLAGVLEWTGMTGGPVLSLLRGTSKISHGFGADELGRAAAAISASATAPELLTQEVDPNETLQSLESDAEAGAAVAAYLDAVRFRGIGYDVGDPNAGEMPEMLVQTLRAATNGTTAAPHDGAAEAAIREKVPEQHRAEFDSRLAEARLVNRLRDERDAYSDGWATGLARRALLEAGRRLAAQGRLVDAEHA